MSWHLSYRAQFFSILPPDEVLHRLQSSLLPVDAPTWRDDYQAGDELLCQGNIAANSFSLFRFRKKPVYREAGPFPLLGQVTPYKTGSCIALCYSMFSGGWFVLGFQLVLVGLLIVCGTVAIWFHSHTFPWFSALLLSTLPLYVVVSVYFSL